MELADKIIKIITQYDLYIEENVFSKEQLIRSFAKFISSTSERDKHNTGFVMHTGSICFDALAIIYAAVSCMIYNESDTEEIISSLSPGDLVLYTPDKRPVKGEFKGFFNYIRSDFQKADSAENASYLKLICQKKRRNKIENDATYVPKKSWNRISPYRGQSTNTDGRGIRKTSGLRDVFYTKALGFKREDIPSVVAASAVIVMQNKRAEYLYKNIEIGIDDKTRIKLSDLVTASYYTESEEHPCSGNIGKTEPVLKITGKVSVARRLAFSRRGNRHLGVIISGNEPVRRYITEIPAILDRRSLKYVFVLANMDSESVPELLINCENPAVFACSKKFLETNSSKAATRNRLTAELEEQSRGILNKKISRVEFSSSITWDEYKSVRQALKTIKRSDFSSDKKDEFVITAFTLLNLFSTAVFKMSDLEACIEAGKIGIASPSERLSNLNVLIEDLPEYLRDKATAIAESLSNQYLALYDNCEKERYLKKELRTNYSKKYAIVVPKAYYKTVMIHSGMFAPPVIASKVSVLTANGFNADVRYNKIIVTGNFQGNRFDVFRCISADDFESLIYSYEKKVYNQRAQRAEKNIRLLNDLNSGNALPDDIFSYDSRDTEPDEKEICDIYEFDKEVDDYISRINDAVLGSLFTGENRGYGNATTHVVKMGVFETGERIFFTKRYKAYTFDDTTSEVKESKVEELEEGLSLVFTQYNSETRDIVDDILNRLIKNGKLSPEISDCYALSKQWKEKLREYKMVNNLKSRDIADRMIKSGVAVGEGTIRGWLDEDAHTIGPQKIDSIEQIAYLIGDDDMLNNAKKQFEAIRTIRKVRMTILRYIGEAIIDKLSGQLPKDGEIMEYIYKRIDSLAIILRLESIADIDKEIPFNSANRPISV